MGRAVSQIACIYLNVTQHKIAHRWLAGAHEQKDTSKFGAQIHRVGAILSQHFICFVFVLAISFGVGLCVHAASVDSMEIQTHIGARVRVHKVYYMRISLIIWFTARSFKKRGWELRRFCYSLDFSSDFCNKGRKVIT